MMFEFFICLLLFWVVVGLFAIALSVERLKDKLTEIYNHSCNIGGKE